MKRDHSKIITVEEPSIILSDLFWVSGGERFVFADDENDGIVKENK